MAPPVDDELLGVLARRGTVLRYLAETDGGHKRDVVDALDVSRSTVDRAVRELERHDLVERRDGTLRATLPGVLALEEFDRVVARLDGLDRASAVLTDLPVDVPLDPSLFQDASVTVPSPEDPHRPSKRVADLLAESITHRSVTGSYLPHHVDVYAEQIIEGGTTAELLVTDDVLTRLLRDHRDLLRAGLDAENLTLRRIDRDLSFSLRLSIAPERTTVGLLVYGDVGPTGFVESTDEEAVEWATDFVDEYWAAGTPVRAGDLADGE